MFHEFIQRWLTLLKHVVTQPRKELNRWQMAVRFAYDMGVHGWKALQQDNAPQMAAALAYRTLFALLPVLLVATVITKGVLGNKFLELAGSVIDGLRLGDIKFVSSGTTAEADGTAEVALGTLLKDVIKDVAQINLQAVGWIGFAILVYAAITMMVTVENSFNTVFRAPQGRPWIRRVTTYWFVLTLGPAAIALVIYVNTQFDLWIHSVEAGQFWIAIAATLWSFSVAWAFMFFIYWLIPNTRVGMRPALVGAFVAAILLEIGRHTLGIYFSRAFTFSFIFSALGLLPVFMFWLYLMWLVVLFGLEVAATIQFVQTHSLRELEGLEEKRPQAGLVDPAAVVVVMESITERFAAGRSTPAREIADETGIPESVVTQMLTRLVQAGMLHWVETEDRAVALARPPEQIAADRLIEIGYSIVDEGSRGRQSWFVQRLRQAQKRLAHRATLASMVAQNPVNQVPPA